MKKINAKKMLSVIVMAVMVVAFTAGCGTNKAAETPKKVEQQGEQGPKLEKGAGPGAIR